MLCKFWNSVYGVRRELLTQTLRSIESMKMETVIRSPQKGVVKKLAHKEGVSALCAVAAR